MISISVRFLTMIGVELEAATQMTRTADGSRGLAVSSLFSFAGGGDRRGYDAFCLEPEPRTALLVGQGDRYGDGARVGTIREICVDPRGDARPPTAEEAAEILAALATCPDPVAAPIVLALTAHLERQ